MSYGTYSRESINNNTISNARYIFPEVYINKTNKNILIHLSDKTGFLFATSAADNRKT